MDQQMVEQLQLIWQKKDIEIIKFIKNCICPEKLITERQKK